MAGRRVPGEVIERDVVVEQREADDGSDSTPSLECAHGSAAEIPPTSLAR